MEEEIFKRKQVGWIGRRRGSRHYMEQIAKRERELKKVCKHVEEDDDRQLTIFRVNCVKQE